MRLPLLFAIALLEAGSAVAQVPSAQATMPAAPSVSNQDSGLGIPRSRVALAGPAEALVAPTRFVTKHQITVKGVKIPYTAIAGETYLYDRAAEPIGSIFSFSYIKDGPRNPKRPVLFVFNGGPGSSSVWLHMGVVGPRRVVLDQEVNPTNTAPFGVADNPHSLIDVADLVFIDPVGTGWSRVIGKGTIADFWGVDEDADSVAQFIELWLTEHRRWNSPRFLMGESYGSARASILPRALMGGPLYVGLMRGITVNGIVLLGTTLQARDVPLSADARVMQQALGLPAMADTAWYYQKIDRHGRTLEALHQEVLLFAKSDYLQALRKESAGTLSRSERQATVSRLVSYTGLPPSAYDKALAISGPDFSQLILADRGLQVGGYDSRYSLPLANSGGDPVADDPAMARYVPGFVAAFHEMVVSDLGVHMDRPYGSIAWKDLLPAWNWKRSAVPPGQSFATDLAVAMRRSEKLRVLVASGYFDLNTSSASAEYDIDQARLPADRVVLRRYASGHMLYLGNTAGTFADDVRTLIRDAAR